MKTLWRFMETFHLLFAQLRDGFSILLRERWRWTTCWEATDVCDRKFCGESRRINSRRPYYNTQILSLGAWCKLRKSAHAIVHEQLGWSKRCARWIPHQLTTEQKEQRVTIRRNWLQLFEPEGPKRFSDVVTSDECQISFFTMKDKHSDMVWVAEDKLRPEVLKTGFRSRRECSPISSILRGLLLSTWCPTKLQPLPHITQVSFTKFLLHIQSTARIQLHHDNASAVPHKARITQTYLDDNGIHLMEHRPYSPDLASCDFWPFPKVKSALAGKHFSKIQDLAQAVHAEMRAVPASEYQECFQKWRMRMQRFIEVEGSYFEGMWL